MEKNSKIYIAGHTGLVGSALYRTLKNQGYTSIIVRPSKELDLTRQNETERFFESERPEYVFLAAAKVGGIIANDTYKAEFIYNNMMIATNVINSSYKYNARKLLNLGSSCIYPRFAPQPMTEDQLLTGLLEPTNEPYAIAKIAAIKLCRYYNEQYGTNYISVMPTNLFGINDNFNLETAHVLPALIRKFYLAKLLRSGDFVSIRQDISKYSLGFGFDSAKDFADDEALRAMLSKLGITAEYVLLWGSGEPYREFLYVDDLANACCFLMKKYDYKDIGEFINIGSGTDMKIKEMAMVVKKIVGFEGEIRHDTAKPDGTPRKLMVNTRLKNLGWTPTIGFVEGIRKEFEWYIS